MDLNLDTLKREILGYLEARDFAVFRSSPGHASKAPSMVLWDSENHPDYQMFLECRDQDRRQADPVRHAASSKPTISTTAGAARRARTSIATSSATTSARLRELRSYEGVTCSLELAFDHDSSLYVYELQPDWYEEFLSRRRRDRRPRLADERSRRRRLAWRVFLQELSPSGAAGVLPDADPGARCRARRRAAHRNARRQSAGASRASAIPTPRAASSIPPSTICTIRWPCATCRRRSNASRAPSASARTILIYGDYDVDGTTWSCC